MTARDRLVAGCRVKVIAGAAEGHVGVVRGHSGLRWSAGVPILDVAFKDDLIPVRALRADFLEALPEEP